MSAYADVMGASPRGAMIVLLRRLTAMAEDGRIKLLGTDFEDAYARLRKVEDEAQVDPALLHRSTRVKSGYEGVYVNGVGFRAVGPRGEYIGVYATAAKAAEARYLHYQRLGLPYGLFAEAVEDNRKSSGVLETMASTLIARGRDPEAYLRHYTVHEQAKRGVFYPGLSDLDAAFEGIEPFGVYMGTDTSPAAVALAAKLWPNG